MVKSLFRKFSNYKSYKSFLVVSFFCLCYLWSSQVAAGESKVVTCCPEEQNPQVYSLTVPITKDDEIREIQSALKKAGFYKGSITGLFDQETVLAVREFQIQNNLSSDGVMGKKTRKVLENLFETSNTNISMSKLPKGNVEIVINADKRTLTVYDEEGMFKEYRVAVGKDETPTPIGEWKIKRKALNWGTGFGTRWLGLNVPWGIYGVHGTNKPWSIGGYESHGCIRMFNKSVEEIYPWVQVGTTVKIVGTIYPPLYENRRIVFRGHKGSDVMLIQKGLIAEGYLNQPADGIFGPGTEMALKKLQKELGLEVTGQVTVDIWPILGL